jgi:hypothetical protein
VTLSSSVVCFKNTMERESFASEREREREILERGEKNSGGCSSFGMNGKGERRKRARV